MTRRSNSPKPHSAPLVLGYAQNKDEEAFLLSKGVERIWLKGRGAENLAEHRRAFRKRPGVFAIAADLRILCSAAQPKRPDIVAALADLEKAKITVRDYRVPEATHAELQDAAFKAVANARFTTNRRKAKREGAKGGTRKGIEAQARRNAMVDDGIARRLCAADELTWKRKEFILGISKATLIRNYR